MTTSLAVRTIPPLSQSRYELMACPHSYVEQVIRGVKEAPNPFSIRGTIVHDRLSTYVRHLVQARQTDDVETFDELISDVTGDARSILKRLRELKVNPERVLGTEVYLALNEDLQPIDLSTGVPPTREYRPAYEGTPDLLESPDASTIDITDYKTYWAIIPVDSYQSRHYPLLVFLHYPDVQTVRFHLNFVRFGVSDYVEFTRERDLPRLMEEARAIRMRQQRLHQAFATDEKLDAVPHPGCVYCPLLTDGCPMENNVYSEDPRDLAQFVMWAEQARKKAINVLKDHVAINGPVQIKDANGVAYEAKFNLTETAAYPAMECLDVVATADPMLAKKLTLSGLKDALDTKKRAALKEVLEPMKITTPGSRFGFKEILVGYDEG